MVGLLRHAVAGHDDFGENFATPSTGSSGRTAFSSKSMRMDVPGRPGATNTAYWDALAKRRRYESRIFNSAHHDKDGIVRRALDRAALRAQSSLDDGHPLKAVDIGCGPGKWLPALNYRFDDVKAIDISAGLLEKAEKVVEHERLDNVDVLPAADMGRPCEFDSTGKQREKNGHQLCGPLPKGTQDADVVISVNSLISPDALSRSRMLRRAVDMLRPSVRSTLLLVVPSRESFLRIRAAYRGLGLSKKLGKLADFAIDRPEEESKDVFRAGEIPTQFFTPRSICAEVEAAGLQCKRVREMSYHWRSALPGVTHRIAEQLPEEEPPHLLVVEAHPRTSSALGSHRARNTSLGAGSTQVDGQSDAARLPPAEVHAKRVIGPNSFGGSTPNATADFL